MSGVNIWPITATAGLCCNRCGRTWRSKPYDAERGGWGAEEVAARPAFDLGWRVYVGARERRTYCPSCEPTVPMRLVLPGAGR